MVDSLSYFSFQPVFHDSYNKGRGMCYPVCGIVHIKEPLLLIGKSSQYGSSGFPLSLSEWSFTICNTFWLFNLSKCFDMHVSCRTNFCNRILIMGNLYTSLDYVVDFFLQFTIINTWCYYISLDRYIVVGRTCTMKTL